MFRNVAAKFMVFAFDATTNLPKTGDAANITAYVSIDYGTVTVLADTSATEMDATNAKGYYLFDAAQGETNGDCLMVSAKSSTSNIVVVGAPAVIYTRPTTGWLAPTTAGRTLDVSAGGEAGVDWANVGSPTTSLALTGTTIAVTQKVDVDTIKTNPVVNGGTITFPTTATLASTTNITAGTITTATNVTTVNGLAAAVITAASIAAAALNGKGDWNIGKTGYALSAAGVQAIWDALTSALTTVGSIGKLLVDNVTASVAAIKTQTDKLTFTVANQIDANVLDWKSATAPAMTGDAFARLGAPAGASVSADVAAVKVVDDAIKAKTDNLPASPAAVGSAMTLTSAYDFAKGTVAMTEGYAANGAAPTPQQAFFAIHQMLMDFGISGTNLTVKKLDNSTTAFVVTLNDAVAPTAAARA